MPFNIVVVVAATAYWFGQTLAELRFTACLFRLVLSRVGSPDHIRKTCESNRIFYLFDSFFTNRISKNIDESNIENYSIRFDSFGAVSLRCSDLAKNRVAC